MQTHSESAALAPTLGKLTSFLRKTARRLWYALSAYCVACRDVYAATSTYEQLSRLSDYDLARRELTRADLHRFVFGELTMERPQGPSPTWMQG